jgi:hypothetical protein
MISIMRIKAWRGREAMSVSKRKRILFTVALLVLCSSILATVIFFVHNPFLPGDASRPPPHGTPVITPVLSNVYLNSSTGFVSSLIVGATSSSVLYVLPPGGIGTIPFSVYSPASVPFVASFSTYLGSSNASDYGLRYSFLPPNFTVNPGEHLNAVVTITAGNPTKPVFYLPSISIRTDKEQTPYYIGAGYVDTPALLVANKTPACIYFINAFELAPPVTFPSPDHTPGVYRLILPEINMTAGEEAQFIFCSNKQENLNINTTSPTGITAQFSQTPLDMILSYTDEREMQAINLKAQPNLNPGTYNVQLKGVVDQYEFIGTLKIQIS